MRGRSSILLGTTSAAALLGVILGASLVAPPALADKVGVAAAVNPDAFSSLSGSPQQQLNIGKSIFYNERINTTSSGLVQVLLVDGSTFTVGPGSDLVIDKFVYNPKKQTGQVVASFSKGVMRYVGGKISKNEDAVTVRTPAGTLAIRGGMFQGSVNGNKGIFSFLYGTAMTFTGKTGQTYTVYQPGYTLDLSSGVPKVRPTTAADIKTVMSGLTNSNTSGIGGSADDANPDTQQQLLAETISLQDLISNAAGDKITDTIADEQQNTPEEPTIIDNTPPPDNTPPDNTPPPDDTGQNPPTQIEMRVLTAPGTFTAFPGLPYEYTTHDGAEQGILGGDNLATADDFVRTFTIENDRVIGTVTGLTDSSPGGTASVPPATVNFPSAFPVGQCTGFGVGGVCAVTNATITQNGETKTYAGLAVLQKDFFAYHLLNVPDQSSDDHPEPILAFGGKGHNFGTPSGKTYAFILTPDVIQVLGDAVAPFASAESSPEIDPDKPLPSISPLLYLEKDSNPQSKAVWLQTSLYINTTPANSDGVGFDQESFINVALGGVQDGGLVGARRGGSHVDITTFPCQGNQCGPMTERESLAFTGDIASLAGPDGSHFLGKDDPNIVIGFDSTGTHNIGRDIPLDPSSSSIENQSGSTYHIGVGLGTLQPQPQTLDGTYKGYAAGMVESEVPQNGFTNVVASESPDDFSLVFNKATNTLSANMRVEDVQRNDGATSAYEFKFGDDGTSAATRSAYIDNLHYAAIESTGTATTRVAFGEEFYDKAASTGYLVSGDQLNLTKFFPETFGNPQDGAVSALCNECDFLQWGAWGSRVEFGSNSNPTQYVDNINLGFWVAGDVTDVDALAALGGGANYEGHAIGNVAYNSMTYVATGDLGIYWNFAERAGDLTISKFDQKNFAGGLTFEGPISDPNPDMVSGRFTGTITGQNLPQNLGGLEGAASGSFVNRGGTPAAGVIGNWNVGGENYRATGIFGGAKVP